MCSHVCGVTCFNMCLFSYKYLIIRIKILLLGYLNQGLRELAKLGCVTIAVDHKWIKGKQGDPQHKALGLIAIIASEDGSRTPFMIGYIPVENATDDLTIDLVKDTFKEFGLYDAFKNYQLPICTDAMMRHAVTRLFEEENLDPLKAICTCHNLSNLGKNCLSHIPDYLDNGVALLAQNNQNLRIASRQLENHFNDLPVNDLDIDHVGEIMFDDWLTMTPEQRQQVKLKYQKIPSEYTVRFRNSYERSKGLLSRFQELERINSDVHHPVHNLTTDLDVGLEQRQLLRAIYDMQKHIVGLINYYEKDATFQTTDTINSMLFGFEYCLDIDQNRDNKFEIAVKMSLLDQLTTQLTGYKAIKKDGVWIWHKTTVPTRVERLDLIGAFAFPGDQQLLLNRLIKRLRAAKKTMKPFRSKFQVIIMFLI